ncbi:MAG TPA: histidine kinase [Pseudonocardiaceae bacterium]|nr:histidine kinase [Pseudonocardiaceae bacterium]
MRTRWDALWTLVRLTGLSLLTLLVAGLTVTSLAATLIGLPGMAVSVIENGRTLTERYRQGLRDLGHPADSPYLPATGDDVARLRAMLTDPATWHDLVWMLTLPVTGVVYGIVPILVGPAAVASVVVVGWWAVPVGLALCAATVFAGPWLLRQHHRFDLWLLRPTSHSRLAARVDQLTESRTLASDDRTAETRRIERDLHDGAQARMVAVGMTLRTAERLVETDPVAARALLAEARTTSAAALSELRALVRGIRPPVLVERGLADALRAAALDCPLDVTVHIELTDVPETVAIAVYFAVCELLTNAAKHGGGRHGALEARQDDVALRVRVTDDGRGGADPSGAGLTGVRQRLAPFDGSVDVASPVGGPTEITLEIPCGSS